ncbi:MAG: RecX family transcriptional regulator [Dehalococcoidia bacterium]|nr:MAG: RecX family transcriptional regulator [Dehalococcoidia bacterium]
MVSRITAIGPADRLKRRKVFLDGRLAFSLSAEAVEAAGLKAGLELDKQRSAALALQDRQERLARGARRYFKYRPQSEAELKNKLGRKGTPPAEIEATCARLKAEGLLDDNGFARFWKENRESCAPRSRRLVRRELEKKGVPREVIERVTGEIDDNESAYRAAMNRARRLPGGDYQAFAGRLGGYLARRGFGDETIQETLARVWRETDTIRGDRRLSTGNPRNKGISKGGGKWS